MPIRRVFGASVFRVHEARRHAAARRDARRPFPGARVRSGLVRSSTARWRARVGRTAAVLNRLQFLTIRSYLTLVFCALIVLLLVVAAWR